MKVTYLHHRHGGRITSIDAIEHDTPKGRNQRAYWEFRGRVEWADGTVSESAYIHPGLVCVDYEDPSNVAAAEDEYQIVIGKLNAYLRQNAKSWDDMVWVPVTRKGRVEL